MDSNKETAYSVIFNLLEHALGPQLPNPGLEHALGPQLPTPGLEHAKIFFCSSNYLLNSQSKSIP